jgi:hypothetical protein
MVAGTEEPRRPAPGQGLPAEDESGNIGSVSFEIGSIGIAKKLSGKVSFRVTVSKW